MQRLLLLARIRRAIALLALALLALLAGCGADAHGEADAAETTTTAETAGSVDAPTDATGSDADASVDPCPAPTFELGTNVEGKPVPGDFLAWHDGDVAKVFSGPQGLWMIVVAMRSCKRYTAPLLFDVAVATDDGAAGGTLKLGKQKWVPSGGADDYYYNLWLVMKNPKEADGKMATLTVHISDAKGVKGTHTVRLKLLYVPSAASGP